MFMEALSVSHSSLISLRTAEASLRSDASLGNSVATRVRRFISLLMRSSPCVVRSLRRWSAGIRSTVRASVIIVFEPRGGDQELFSGSE